MSVNIRIGIGYDVHPLIAGRKLILGGVEIQYERGLNGWSDADVLTHAIMDALLGAAALGDIGQHFPPSEVVYEGISSMVLLDEVTEKLEKHGWQVVNVDATIVAEEPWLRDYIGEMRQNLCEVMKVDISKVSVKASTSNGLGVIGRGEGIAAYAVAMIEGKSKQ